MSLNNAHCNGGVVIHQGEVILLHSANVVLSFSGSDELKFGEKSGNAYLTTHRLIFLVGKGHSSSGGFQSFSFPFCVLSEVDVEQPMFGANFLKGKVRAQPDGNWRGEAKFKMVFKSGGAIEFAQGMVRAMQLAKQMTAQSAFWNTPPPSYASATAPGDPSYQQAPPSYYASQNNYYGWMPPAYNFPAPEAGTVFVSEAPPPYPGIGGQAYPQQPAGNPYGGGYPAAPPPQQMQNGNGAYPQQGYGFTPTGYGGGMPQAVPAGGAPGYYPPPNGFAYANGTQAFVPPPASAPPPYAQVYDQNAKKND